MSREILFRAKRVDNGKWTEGYFVKGEYYLDKKEKYVILPLELCFYPQCEINEWIEVAPETVCQYTGLCDKNGRKIFEGDILSYIDRECPNDVLRELVAWNGFSLVTRRGKRDIMMSGWECEHTEVIGNIFDNPELIEE